MTRDPLGNSLLTIDAHAAMEVAAGRRAGKPLGTLDILIAIIAIDTIGMWQTVLLRTAFVTAEDTARFPDHHAEKSGAWSNVPLTRDATEALAVAAKIAEDYKMWPMPPGVLALGLFWD